MVGKKPSKGRTLAQNEPKIVQLGKAVRYYSVTKGNNPFICPNCNNQLFKGIIYEQDNSMYCSRKCIPTLKGV